ncbi:hypothetical protein VKS41_008921 [Umbelopsis sp. WA50703]
MLPQANESDSLLNADIEVNYTSISSRTHSELYSNADLQVDKDKVDTGDIDERLFSWKKLWSYTGPGWLMSIAYLDPGNLESDLQSGALAGYKLLWLLLWSHIAGLVIQILASRLGVVTGQNLAQLIRRNYRREVSFILWAFTQLAIIGCDMQEIVGTAIALKIMFGLKLWVGVLITGFDTLSFIFVQGVKTLEIGFMVLIAVMATCFWIEMVRSKPDIGQIFDGVVYPRVPANAVVQAVGMLGCVIMPHNMYLHSALVMTRDLGKRATGKLREANFYFAIESGLALATSYFINLAIVVVFATVFYKPDMPADTPLPGLYDAATVLMETLGESSKYLWAIGLLAAGQSSVFASTLAGQYVMDGFFGAIFRKNWHRIAINRSVALIPSLFVAVLAVDHFDTMGELLNVVQCICLPTAVIPILKLSASRSIMTQEFQSPRWLSVICWVLSCIIIGFNILIFHTFLNEMELEFPYMIYFIACIYMLFLAYLIITPLRRSDTDWPSENVISTD